MSQNDYVRHDTLNLSAIKSGKRVINTQINQVMLFFRAQVVLPARPVGFYYWCLLF